MVLKGNDLTKMMTEPRMTMEPEDGLGLNEGDDGAGGRSSDLTQTMLETPRNPPKMTPELQRDLGVVPPLSQPCKKNT
jgi:hypothetical protein